MPTVPVSAPGSPASPQLNGSRRGQDSLWAPARRPLTVGLVFTITLVAAEALAISTAMPVVARDLGDLELYGWVFSAFFLGSLIGIAVVGGQIDERGLLVPFVGGLVLFGGGLLIGGLAPSMETLVVGRFIQGLGGGAVPPVAYVAIGRGLPERLRPRMFAVLSAAWVIPGVVGPAIAGYVAEAWHWRAVFLGLLPLLAFAAAVAIRALRAIPDEPRVMGTDRDPNATDAAAAAGAAAAPIANSDAATRIAANHAAAPIANSDAATRMERRRSYGWAVLVSIGAGLLTTGLLSPDLRVLVAVGASGLALMLLAFHRLTPQGTFRLAPGYPSAVLLRGLLTFAFFSVDAYIAFLLVEVRGWSAVAAGLALTGATVTWSLGAWIQSRASVAWVGPEGFVRLGFPIVALGLAGVALALLPDVPGWVVVPTFALSGLGMGLAYSQFAIIVLRDAPRDRQGAVTAAVSLSDTLGTALGTGIAGAIVAASVRGGAGPGPGLGGSIAMGVGVAILGYLLAPRLRHALGGVPARAGPA